MTEHAFYDSAEASFVPAPPQWRTLPDATFARQRDRIAPTFARSDTWSFRSIRRPGAERPAPSGEPLRLLPANRIHLNRAAAPRGLTEARSAEPRAAGDSGLARIGLPDPRAARGAGPARLTAFDIYTAHFGLAARPFSLVPDPDFLFWSTEHEHAFAALEYGVLTRAPITLVTGEIGAGKTTLIHQLINTVGRGVRIALISNTHGSPEEMLRWVMAALDQPTPRNLSYPELVGVFQDYLIAQYAKGDRVILIFDEAQNLCAEALEELRLLTNINSSKDELLQLLLVGQPELRDRVNQPGLRQFAQRVAASFHLTAMNPATVRAYIAHRLSVAGQAQNIFSEAATDLICEATGGIPRRVNQLCDLALVYAFTAAQKTVGRAIIRQVLDDGTFFGANAAGPGAMMQAAE